ncbi:hypothetical protein ACFQ0G_11595 [Streptomyces chiangmaiensis]
MGCLTRRPGDHLSGLRILFAFDPWRSSVLLVAGDERNRWTEWYAEAIPLAEQRYADYVKIRTGGGCAVTSHLRWKDIRAAHAESRGMI